MEDADDVVERAAVDRVARVRGVDHGGERLLRRKLDGERHDLGPRDHHVVRLLVREVEDLVEHLLLRLLDLLGLRHDQADVLLRVHRHPGGRRLDAEEPRDAVRRLLQDPDERIGDPSQPVERHGEPDGQALGPLERDRLRHELAEHHAQVGQDQEREQEGDAAGDPVAEEAERSGSPRAPRRMPKTVIPTCTVEMKRTGSSSSLSAVLARRLPRFASSSSRPRRAVTSEYSAATKTAFPSTSRRMTTSRRESLTRPPASVGTRRFSSKCRTEDSVGIRGRRRRRSCAAARSPVRGRRGRRGSPARAAHGRRGQDLRGNEARHPGRLGQPEARHVADDGGAASVAAEQRAVPAVLRRRNPVARQRDAPGPATRTASSSTRGCRWRPSGIRPIVARSSRSKVRTGPGERARGASSRSRDGWRSGRRRRAPPSS